MSRFEHPILGPRHFPYWDPTGAALLRALTDLGFSNRDIQLRWGKASDFAEPLPDVLPSKNWRLVLSCCARDGCMGQLLNELERDPLAQNARDVIRLALRVKETRTQDVVLPERLVARIRSSIRAIPGISDLARRAQILDYRHDSPARTSDDIVDDISSDSSVIIALCAQRGLNHIYELLLHCGTFCDEHFENKKLGPQFRELAEEVTDFLTAFEVDETTEYTLGGAFRIIPEFQLERGVMHPDHAREGNNVSPSLSWSGAPPNTDSFVLVLRNLDRNGEIHWIQRSIPRKAAQLPRDAGAYVPDNKYRRGIGTPSVSDLADIRCYIGPTPTQELHRYEFALYALPPDTAHRAVHLERGALVQWLENECVEERASKATHTAVFQTFLTQRTYFFAGHRVLSRLLGIPPWKLALVLSLWSVAILLIPAWIVGTHDVPASAWVPQQNMPTPNDNRGIFYQWNWIFLYTFAVPIVCALCSHTFRRMRRAIREMSDRAFGVIHSRRDKPFMLFVHEEVQRLSKWTTLFSLTLTTLVIGIDVAQLVECYVTGQCSQLRPYWAVAYMYDLSPRVDVARNEAFSVIAYMFEAGLVYFMAFTTAKLATVLLIVYRIVQDAYTNIEDRALDSYQLLPEWYDRRRRRGVDSLGSPYNCYIVVSMTLCAFVFAHRLQLIAEIEPGMRGYIMTIKKALSGDTTAFCDLGGWGTMTPGIIAALVAIVIPAGTIAYFPLIKTRIRLRKRIAAELERIGLERKNAPTEEERVRLDELAAQARAVSLWPNGDRVASVSMYMWCVLFGASLYPPVIVGSVLIPFIALRRRDRV